MNIINSFLEKLHTDESMFPMDNYATDESEDEEEIVSEQKKNSNKKRIMIDLDGTIHKYSKGWNGGEIYDPPFEGSIDAIKWLKNQGFEIIIFTGFLIIVIICSIGVHDNNIFNLSLFPPFVHLFVWL